MLNNSIEISYCSRYILSLLKKKGFILSSNEVSYDIVIKWLLLNYKIYVWADYDTNLKYWRGNYIILNEISNWFSGFKTPDLAIETTIECVLEHLIPNIEE